MFTLEKVMLAAMILVITTQIAMFLVQIRLHPDWILTMNLGPRVYYVLVGMILLIHPMSRSDRMVALLSCVLFQFASEVISLVALLVVRWRGFRVGVGLLNNGPAK